MNNYEVLYIIQNELTDDAKSALVEKFSKLVESLGGTVDTLDKWGTRKYAYPINYKNEGYYVLMTFTADAAAPTEIDRQMRITEGVVRSMILKK